MVMDLARSHIPKMDIPTMEPARYPLNRGNGKICQLRIYSVNRDMVRSWVKIFADAGVRFHERWGASGVCLGPQCETEKEMENELERMAEAMIR